MQDKFNKKVNYFFLGCGTEEQMGTKQMVDSLRKLGIEVDYYESQGTGARMAHMETLPERVCTTFV